MADLAPDTPFLWSSPLLFFLVVLGALAGVDTFSEFPYLLVRYGGARFVAVYVAALVVLAWPLIAAQLTLGRHLHGVAGLLDGRDPGTRGWFWRWTARAAIAGGFLVFCYVAVFAGWMMAYAHAVMGGAFHDASVPRVAAYFTHFTAQPLIGLGWDAAFVALVLIVVVTGPAAIEDLARLVVPALVALLAALAVYSASLGGFFLAAPLLLEPAPRPVTISAVLIALSQAFFGTGVGTASLVAYGAYVPVGAPILRLSLGLVLAQAGCAWLGGFALASLAFAAGLRPLAGGGFLFETLPLVSERLPHGDLIAGLAYLALIAAAWLSTVAWLEPLVQIAMARGLGRGRAVLGIGLAALTVGGIVVLSLNSWAFSFSFLGRVKTLGFLDVLMILAVNVLLPWGGGGLAALMGWRDDQAGTGPQGWGRVLWRWALRVVVPTAVLVVFLTAPRLIL
ncbi:MAG: hypothetical protein ACYCXG_01820 [Acidiferrobacter sp.]